VELFSTFNDVIRDLRTPGGYLLICGVMSVLLYACFNKKDELGRNAVQNTAATTVVYALNLGTLVFFHREISAFMHSVYDVFSIVTLPEDTWTGSAIWLGIALVIVGQDFCDYVIHRVLHTKWGWPAHAAHHTDTHVNGFTTFRIHMLESLLMTLTYIVALTWLQLPELMPALALLKMVHNFYVHLDLDWTHGRFRYLLASPAFHRWHHADVPEAQGKNLANMIPLFDLIFGTYYHPGPCKVPLGALQSGLSDKNPILIWIYPFQTWARMCLQSARVWKTRLLSPWIGITANDMLQTHDGAEVSSARER
jgi:sterol desaturase/sphingolipid hydroxylase (fatty acid hydroxylase superfamily)